MGQNCEAMEPEQLDCSNIGGAESLPPECGATVGDQPTCSMARESRLTDIAATYDCNAAGDVDPGSLFSSEPACDAVARCDRTPAGT
jgi:hypothetical protein